MRARFGVKSTPTDNSQLELRLATGTGRTSTNQQLGGSGNGQNYSILLDRANVKINLLTGTDLYFGRYGSVLLAAGGSDLIFDADLNFDGITLKDETSFGGVDLTSSLSHYAIDSRGTTSSSANSVNLSVAQVGTKFKMEGDKHILAYASYFYYDKIKGHGAISTFGDNSNASSLYTKDYELASVGLEYKMKLGSKNFVVFAEGVQNTATSDDNMGYIGGVKYGGMKAKSDWMVGYDYRSLEKDSTLGAFTDGESFGGGVNGSGHRLQAGYQLGSNWSLSTSLFVGEKFIASGETSKDRNRILFDLNAWF